MIVRYKLYLQTTLARGFKPSSLAFSTDVRIKAEAPSLIGDELAAVIVPSFLKAERRVGTLSKIILLNSSSSRTTVSPFLPLTVTGMISVSNAPDSQARAARL